MAKKIRKSRKTSKPVEAATTSAPAEAPQVERATADQIATGTVVSATSRSFSNALLMISSSFGGSSGFSLVGGIGAWPRIAWKIIADVFP